MEDHSLELERRIGLHNLGFVERLHAQYLRDPASVPPAWRRTFETWTDRSVAGAAEPRPPDGTADPRSAASTPPPRGPAAAPPPVRTGRVDGDGSSPAGEGTSRTGFLSALPLFASLEEEEIERIAALARERRLSDGETLCRRGDPGSDLFLVAEGGLVIRQGDRVVARLGPGEVVGELAVLDGRPRSADVVASGPVRLLEIAGDDFQALLCRHGVLAARLLGVLASRVRDTGSRQERVDRLVRAFRERGHVLADLDPLGFRRPGAHPELTLEWHGLDEGDLDAPVTVQLGPDVVTQPLREVLERLRSTYCGAVGVQYMHVDDLEVQRWLRERLEDPGRQRPLDPDEQRRVLSLLTDAEVFETFLHQQFVGAKRFSLEGGETLIPLLDETIDEAARHGVEEVVLGMAHRGRLNVLAHVLGKPASRIFREFRDLVEESTPGGGDVKYHLGFSSDRRTSSGRDVHVTLTFNPSHLEFVGPVVLGRARAKQARRAGGGQRRGDRVLPVVIHGDAAFAGQGVVQETLNLTALPGYETGGALHVVLNNQIGFTTDPEEGRSTEHATDVARMLQVPIFHVNGERPEAVHRVVQIALEFRARFRQDVVVDMLCYRRHGHNEMDEAAFTQPLLARAVERRPPIRETFAQNVLALGGLSSEEAERIVDGARRRLEDELADARRDDPTERPSEDAGVWSAYRGGPESEAGQAETAVDETRLRDLLRRTVEVPDGFTPHRLLKRLFRARREMADGERPLDWSAGEALAFATLLLEGHPVRLSGQDSQRGTFSHRHAVLHDARSGELHVPLASLAPDQGRFEAWNSPLSEIGVLGFDFGYSLDDPEALVVWEAQFGDFCNVAQVILDQFVASSEDKWRRLSGLCLFLPHGFEGQGPEHSSARLERFLQLSAEDNWQVVSPTTPAQLFHCLRRQVLRPWRKPLVVMSPKSLLRSPRATSSLEDLSRGGFRAVLPDPTVEAERASRLVLCTGKLFHELDEERERRGLDAVRLVRLEQLYPFRADEVAAELAGLRPGAPVVWAQEEPENMGAWSFVERRLRALLPAGAEIDLVSRPESSSPATGSKARHDAEQAALLREALGA